MVPAEESRITRERVSLCGAESNIFLPGWHSRVGVFIEFMGYAIKLADGGTV